MTKNKVQKVTDSREQNEIDDALNAVDQHEKSAESDLNPEEMRRLLPLISSQQTRMLEAINKRSVLEAQINFVMGLMGSLEISDEEQKELNEKKTSKKRNRG